MMQVDISVICNVVYGQELSCDSKTTVLKKNSWNHFNSAMMCTVAKRAISDAFVLVSTRIHVTTFLLLCGCLFNNCNSSVLYLGGRSDRILHSNNR